ncbi:MAG: carboxypeptidase-like regulatory domain-containing protein [Melioribacteraceae bacterium]|nr:carboxypeptidase-like regulatory domain-containing protein [Melioribacteraceae bacterium]
MKYKFVLFFMFAGILYAQNIELRGRVVDANSLAPLVGVNIQISNSTAGTSTDFDGQFQLSGKFNSNDTVNFSFLGYKTQSILAGEFLGIEKLIKLERELLRFDKTIIVQGIIAKEGFTPASFSKIERREIEENYTLQDIPEYLSYLPSTTFYSESGNGLGYNFLRIRGFGQRRISIAYNGIPQNDPEDHNVYWHNITDLLESAEIVQVQRGAGAGMIGYPSIGGSINIITSSFSDKPQFTFSSSFGSYNTRKYSAKFSSGLIDNKYSVYAKLSKVLSDGYRDNSWVDFNSYHVSAARDDENLKTVINLYGGPVYDGLAYFGIPKSYIKDRKLRKTNFLSKDEIEEFSQPHYELLNEYTFSDDLVVNSALFFVSGEGYFDYDGSWSIFYDDYFRLKENGFTEDQLPTNALIRALVENKQWGWVPKLTWEHNNGTLIIGGEYRNHSSVHWGAIRYAENIPENVPQS